MIPELTVFICNQNLLCLWPHRLPSHATEVVINRYPCISMELFLCISNNNKQIENSQLFWCDLGNCVRNGKWTLAEWRWVGVAECWSGGMTECRRVGVSEWRSGGVAEWSRTELVYCIGENGVGISIRDCSDLINGTTTQCMVWRHSHVIDIAADQQGYTVPVYLTFSSQPGLDQATSLVCFRDWRESVSQINSHLLESYSC